MATKSPPNGPAALKRALDSRGMSPSDLERSINVSKGTAWHWLNGSKVPGLDSALAIRDLLGVPVESWATKKGKPAQSKAVA